MSVITEILDRLSGVATVREKLNNTATRIEKLSDIVLDHERRIITLEVSGRRPRARALPKPKRS